MARRPTDSPNWGGARPGAGAPRRAMPQRIIRAQVPVALHRRAQDRAISAGCSLSALVRAALEAHLA